MAEPSSSSTSSAQNQASTSKRPVVPAASFADVLKDLSKDDDPSQEENRWVRTALQHSDEGRPPITFQKLDIRESNTESGSSEIQLFGVTKTGHSILARVLNFEHYFYYPAPDGFQEADLDPLCDYLNRTISARYPIVSGIELEEQSTTSDGKPLPFLKIHLSDHRYMRNFKDKPNPFSKSRLSLTWIPTPLFSSGNCEYKGLFSSPEVTYEGAIPYFLRFMIKALSWLKLPADKYDTISLERRVSCCQLEVSVDVDDLLICDPVDNKEKMAPLRILSFDIECNIPKKKGSFSSPKSDSVIQIGNMVTTYGQTVPFIRNVFTFGSCTPISGTQVLSFEDEKEMLMAWHDFFVEVDPDIIIGYNVTQFDIPYLLARSRALKAPNFPFLGRVKSSPQRMPTKEKTHFLECPGYEGRLILDVYHHIRERFPDLQGEGIYKLNGVSMHFLGQKKEDIHYSQIPVLQHGNADSRRDLAVYCLKDVYLPLLLFDKLKCLEKEVKEAKEAYVPFNVMRVWRPCIETAKRCLHAIQHHYVMADR